MNRWVMDGVKSGRMVDSLAVLVKKKKQLGGFIMFYRFTFFFCVLLSLLEAFVTCKRVKRGDADEFRPTPRCA